jgi:ribosome-associated translation inhibitor RaiA
MIQPNNEINFSNFNPEIDQRRYAEDLIDTLSELVPFGGNFKVRISKALGGIEVDVSLKNGDLDFHQNSRAHSVYVALDLASKDIEREISGWRSRRRFL